MTQFDWNYEKYLKDNTNNSIKRKTALDWFIEQLEEFDKELDGIRKSDDSTVVKLNPTRIYDQAKQMEKEQIINAFDIACEDENRIGEEYYNDTYGGQGSPDTSPNTKNK